MWEQGNTTQGPGGTTQGLGARGWELGNTSTTRGPGVESVSEWVGRRLGFEPDGVQRRLLDTAAGRVILNCTRQWGKSTTTAAKAVHHAYTKPESLTLVVSPSARQSGEFLRKAAGFA